MSPTSEQLAVAFSRHDFETVQPHMAADIQWIIVAGETLSGRDRVMARCRQSVASLAKVSTKFKRFRVFLAGEHIVVDSEAEYTDPGGARMCVACADIYRFADKKLVEITSYNVEVPGR